MKSQGLGDTVENFTKATGLKTLTEIAAKAVGYSDCGCNKRKKWLNSNFPYYKIKDK
tara:strand:- start:746 stop:916 length:171 start_codon:yes stop_codon:yes gene_type:complete